MIQDILGAIFFAAPFILAIAAAVAAVLGMVAAGAMSKHWSDSNKVAVIFGTLILGGAIAIAVSGRTILSQDELNMQPWLSAREADGASKWIGRFTNLIVILICVGEIWNWISGKRRIPVTAKSVWLALLAFYLSSYWVGVVFATSREIQLSWIYAPIAYTAFALIAGNGLNDEALKKVQLALVIVLAASLVGGLLVPGLTIERGYKSLVPGLNFRLHGLSDHANSLGVIAALSVLLEVSPFVRKRPNWLYLGIALLALILAQSKTSWVLAVLGVLLVRLETFGSGVPQRKRWTIPLIGSLVVVLGLAILLIGFAIAVNLGALDALASRRDLTTFTGRTRIWEISWNEFVKSPIFGYGPAIWDIEYRIQHKILAAGQAHNQFFQTIGQAGGLGILTMLVYVGLLGRNCVRAWKSTLGLSVVLFVGLLVRCFSESPLRMAGLDGLGSLIHLMTFGFAVRACKSSSSFRPRNTVSNQFDSEGAARVA